MCSPKNGLRAGLIACGLLASGCDVDRLVVCSGGSIGAVRAALLNGSPRAEFLALGPAQEAAIVQLVTKDAAGAELGSCTGVAIGKRWVLSAAHCMPNGSSAKVIVSVGEGASSLELGVEAQLAGRLRELDLCILELAEQVEDFAALPLSSRVPEPDSWVQLAGFGENELGQLGHRRFVTEQVTGLDGDSIVVDGRGRSGACQGDSGGPLLVRDWDGSPAVAGILRRGNVACTGVDRYTRVELAREWIKSIAGVEPPLAACGAVTSSGRCFDGVAVWCNGTQLQSERCRNGLACGWHAAATGFRCVTPAQDPCSGVDDRGRCDGAVLSRCDAGVLEQSDCGICGARCVRNAVNGTVDCERATSTAPPPFADTGEP